MGPKTSTLNSGSGTSSRKICPYGRLLIHRSGPAQVQVGRMTGSCFEMPWADLGGPGTDRFGLDACGAKGWKMRSSAY